MSFNYSKFYKFNGKMNLKNRTKSPKVVICKLFMK
jgi:hypothetical protein